MQSFLSKRETLMFYLSGERIPGNIEEKFLIKRQAFTCTQPPDFRIWFVLPDGRLHGEERDSSGLVRIWNKGVISVFSS
ncbi:hypothetical protein A9K97_gp077 [Tokyovirus A1]|uniref:hypothetical protein n=1 Tax=Tokyovirus A1 TaxID=1826170 RepID=UPI0007A95FC5|nr:hypothetical protein A9K97_gp077 [Tokyovirus A1]BAU80274.1 hypothetical protein [Tokyovirus A1]